MKKFRLINNDELVAIASDLNTLVRTVDALPAATADEDGNCYFLRKTCALNEQIFMQGYVYKCVSYYETNPTTGIKTIAYRWEVATYSESGSLDKVTNVIIERVSNSSADLVEDSSTISWTDPLDKKAEFAEDNATWAYTVVVRKLLSKVGNANPSAADIAAAVPKSIDDGEIVGISGVRSQYENHITYPFHDHYPKGTYPVYNIFAVTKYGVVTGMDADESQELTWRIIYEFIARGEGGKIFSIGDCVTVDHGLLGPVDLQVVHMTDNVPYRDKNGNVVNGNGVIFMSRRCLPRCTYDAKEKRVNDSNRKNPADAMGEGESRYYASNRGRADWITSNLRQFLNRSTGFQLSEDRHWDMNKFYFTREDDAATGNVIYTQVPIPIWPDRVNPYELYYYEVEKVFVPQHDWDNDVGPNEQPCIYGDRELPGFYDFLQADFRDVLVDTEVSTVMSPLTTPPEEGDANYPVRKCYDKIFIPSYKELIGKNCSTTITGYEGMFWSYFNTDVTIPGVYNERSLVKYDLNGKLCGYYTRSLGTIERSGGLQTFGAASSVWSVKSKGFTKPPRLGSAKVMTSVGCSLSKMDAARKDSLGTLTAPGVAWCCMIAGRPEELEP